MRGGTEAQVGQYRLLAIWRELRAAGHPAAEACRQALVAAIDEGRGGELPAEAVAGYEAVRRAVNAAGSEQAAR